MGKERVDGLEGGVEAPPPRREVALVVRPVLVLRDGVAAPLRADGEPPDRLPAAVRRLAVAALRAAGTLAFAAAGACAFAAAAACTTGATVATAEVATGWV